jgi:pimeloyl-ACP methyl ester carboxylesterase
MMVGGTGTVGPWWRAVASFLTVVAGLVAISVLFAGTGWSWLLMSVVGVASGATAGRARLVGLAILGVIAFHALAIALDLPRDTGPFWYIAAAGSGLLLTLGFAFGADLGWRRPPFSSTLAGWRSLGRWPRRLIVVLGMVVVGASLAYGTYAATAGSAEFVDASVATPDCRTPTDRYGWSYDAINYDKADDARMSAANPDKTKCSVRGTPAGTDVVTSDGIRLAGWYIPAASGIGPTGPTLLIVHGWKADKSGALEFAPPFHQDYNLVLFDLRNNGQSSGAQTSLGLYEQRDVVRMVDWLETTKHPSWIGAVGNSMGAATVLAAAVTDQRIKALILDSMHADIVTSVGNAMEADFGYPGGPAAWALMVGVSVRVGGDVTSVDPVKMIGKLGDRPVLLLQGLADQVDPPSEASDRNFEAALDAGVSAEIGYCQGARHGLVLATCPTQWTSWALSFMERAQGR